MSGPRHLARATRRTGREKFLIALGVLVTAVLAAGAGALGYATYRFGQIERVDVAIDIPPASGEPRNYLLVGSDGRDGLDESDPGNAVFFGDDQEAGGPLRTDTIMILRVDPDESTARLLSFPRDLWVPIADTGEENRINVAYTRGREVLMDTIRENFGIPIHHYVEIDFVGFLGLVEAMGGVPFYFDSPVRDTHSGLDVATAGCVTLDGRQALAFARSRHLEIQDVETGSWETDPSGDLGRISRQQAFVRESISRAASKGLGNPARLNQLVGVGVEFVALDPTLSASDIIGLGRRFASFESDELETYSVPGEPFRTSAGASVLELDQRAAEPMFNIFRGLDPDELTPGLVDVTVLNGQGRTGFAGDISDALDRVGFVVAEPGNVDTHYEHTTVHYAPGSEEAATRLARHLTSPVDFEFDEELDADEVVLIAGDDFTTVHETASPDVPDIERPTTTTTEASAADAGGDEGGDDTTGAATTSSTTTTTEVVGYVPDADQPMACG